MRDAILFAGIALAACTVAEPGAVEVSPSEASDVASAPDPLPSWRDGPVKQRVVAFVVRTTTPGASDFVPVAERIAVFDNDGTLWSEQPMYVQLAFAIDRIRELAPQHPTWRERQPFQGILEGDLDASLAGGERAAASLIVASHAGMTTDDFEGIVERWLADARHPRFERPYTSLVYQPMLELLVFLRAHGFQTYICSGGGAEFIRPWAEQVYGVARSQVIGSLIETKLVDQEGEPVLMRLPEVDFVDDGAGKPVGVYERIGRRPIVAFGNSDGDLEMLQWVTAGDGARLGVLIHHTDAAREFAYDRGAKAGALAEALDAASGEGWVVVDMKRDWERVFPFDPD